jgi:hypothetical protein
MKILSFVLCILGASSSFAASGRASNRVTQNSASLLSSPSSITSTDVKAILNTNIVGLTQGKGNIGIDVMMNNKLAVALTYLTNSEEETRSNGMKLTVDRTQIGVGATYYFYGIEAKKNIALSPTLIFGNEKDAVKTENQNGLGLRVLGIFKPMEKLMLQAGVSATSINGTSRGDGYLGLGLIF